MKRTPVIFGNWKMHKTKSETENFIIKVEEQLVGKNSRTLLGIAIPATQLDSANKLAKKLKIIAQNVHHETSGAFTGAISALMLADLKIKYCLVGHSERRKYFGESNEMINKQIHQLLINKIIPIFCLGESLAEYATNQTNKVIKKQLEKGLAKIATKDVAKIIIAYEPVWAIGTGKVATPQIAQKVINFIRIQLVKLYSKAVAKKIIIQYGGSVKPENIQNIMQEVDIDGVLVGGASLNWKSFLQLYERF